MKSTIDIAIQASCFPFEDGYTLVHIDQLKAFEAIVRADAIAGEREACAGLAEKEAQYSVATAIRERSANERARGEAK